MALKQHETVVFPLAVIASIQAVLFKGVWPEHEC